MVGRKTELNDDLQRTVVESIQSGAYGSVDVAFPSTGRGSGPAPLPDAAAATVRLGGAGVNGTL